MKEVAEKIIELYEEENSDPYYFNAEHPEEMMLYLAAKKYLE